MASRASSCASSQSSRPLISASSSDCRDNSNPDSPRTSSNCKEGRLDSTEDECICATSPPLSTPFGVPPEKERSLREHDEALSLIESLDDGWFRDNVVSCRWRQGTSQSAGVEGFGTAAARDRLAVESASGHGVRTPDAAGLSASQRDVDSDGPSRFRSIEMVAPLVGSRSFSGERDARDLRDLPRSRLNTVTRRKTISMDDSEMFFSDSEQKHLLGAQEDSSTFSRLFGEMRIEPSKLGPSRRRRKPVEDIVVPARRFSDGDETSEEVNAPLSDVREEGESASEDNPSTKTQVPRKLELPRKLEAISTSREWRNPLVESNTKLAPLQRRRVKKDRRKCSKSMTEIEYDEMRGCMDLGFSINKDNLTPRVVNVFPGLKSAYSTGDDFFDSPRERGNSPQGWPRRPDSPLLKFRMPASNGSSVDMKAHLKFWAHAVASTVCTEC